MSAITKIPSPHAANQFAATLRSFNEHARAVASGYAEGGYFTWFLAIEYQWEMETAAEWLVSSRFSELSDNKKNTLRHFLSRMPDIRKALADGRQAAMNRPRAHESSEWVDWLEIAALPDWNNFTVRTAILLSQLGNPARNDSLFILAD